MYCKSCGRKKVNNYNAFLSNEMAYCFAVDLEDRFCDSCEAKKRAGDCINAIRANIKIKRNKLEQATIINEDKFQIVKAKIINYWKKLYTPDIDLIRYGYWFDKFNECVNAEFGYQSRATGL